MTAKITKRQNPYAGWVKGEVGEYCFTADVTQSAGSYFGIEEGRVSFLTIWDVNKKDEYGHEKAVVQFAGRKWIVPPNERTKPYVDAVLNLFPIL